MGSKWEMTLDNRDHSESPPADVQAILAALELQLAALDRIGARIAAAHCDAAIEQLRRYQAGA